MKDTTLDEANDFVVRHLQQSRQILDQIDVQAVTRLVRLIAETRAGGGRLFLLGVGGSAANCSHAVNDFRKLCGLESYAPTDNVSELTARINDEGWAGVFAAWLQASRLNQRDMVFIMSVGGGDLEKNVSPNLVEAIKLAKTVGAKVGGIVGRDGGYTARVADACVIIPPVAPEAVTPHTEAFQAVIWHLLVSHPLLKAMATKWESVVSGGKA
jgi:D-sedoheptulose 7-phosphate isomerase